MRRLCCNMGRHAAIVAPERHVAMDMPDRAETMIAKRFTLDELTDLFDYLDALRESGFTDMFGASEFLARDHDLNAREASAVLAAWMRSFRDGEPPDDRAAKVIEEYRIEENRQ
jgi:hypothetical protein